MIRLAGRTRVKQLILVSRTSRVSWEVLVFCVCMSLVALRRYLDRLVDLFKRLFLLLCCM